VGPDDQGNGVHGAVWQHLLAIAGTRGRGHAQNLGRGKVVELSTQGAEDWPAKLRSGGTKNSASNAIDDMLHKKSDVATAEARHSPQNAERRTPIQ
jgi:hypothetical protein